MGALEEHAWDGDWYRRAYFDDGAPLGSRQNDECQIKSIAQTSAVISGAGDPERARQAMAAVEDRLVRETDKMILLFTPPFDRGSLEPGYIKGYVPGIRENGGQYTHAATWVVLATALLGRGERALELFALLNPGRKTRRDSRRRRAVHWRNPTLWRRMSMGRRRMQGGAAVRGTPARPAGCTASVSRRFSVSTSEGTDCGFSRASRRTGRVTSYLPSPFGDLPHRRREQSRCRPRRAPVSWMHRPCAMAISRSWMTERPIPFESSLADGQRQREQDATIADQLPAKEDSAGCRRTRSSPGFSGPPCWTTFTRPTRTTGWSATRPTPPRRAASQRSVSPWRRSQRLSSAACSFASSPRRLPAADCAAL